VRDRVVLEPYEVNETAEVSSVLLEAVVQDQRALVRNLPPAVFALFEDGVPQTLDLVMQEAMGATFALLVDSSASMARRMDFVQRTASTLAGYMTDRDRMLVAPFSKQILSTTGPTDDVATIREAIEAISPAGAPPSSTRSSRSPAASTASKAAARSSSSRTATTSTARARSTRRSPR
jgi:hypothetical protein